MEWSTIAGLLTAYICGLELGGSADALLSAGGGGWRCRGDGGDGREVAREAPSKHPPAQCFGYTRTAARKRKSTTTSQPPSDAPWKGNVLLVGRGEGVFETWVERAGAGLGERARSTPAFRQRYC